MLLRFNWTSFTLHHYPLSITQAVMWWWSVSLHKIPSARLEIVAKYNWVLLQYEFTLLAKICANWCSWVNIFQHILGHVIFFSLYHSLSYLYQAGFCVMSASSAGMMDGNDWFRSNLYCWLIYQHIGLVLIVTVKVWAFIYRLGNKWCREWRLVLCASVLEELWDEFKNSPWVFFSNYNAWKPGVWI